MQEDLPSLRLSRRDVIAACVAGRLCVAIEVHQPKLHKRLTALCAPGGYTLREREGHRPRLAHATLARCAVAVLLVAPYVMACAFAREGARDVGIL